MNDNEAKQESQILTELTQLKENVSKIKDIIDTDITPLAKTILDKIDINTYEFTTDEDITAQEIEEIIEYIENKFNDFYQYSEEDLDKLITK
jgi:hypothetical protein